VRGGVVTVAGRRDSDCRGRGLDLDQLLEATGGRRDLSAYVDEARGYEDQSPGVDEGEYVAHRDLHGAR